jgi:(R)-2-hydroxyacyl-CoA dehydratese activating ATPase
MNHYYVGIDIGSSAIKIAIIDSFRQIKAFDISPTGSSFRTNTEIALKRLLSQNGILESELKFIISTGYGRKLLPIANETVSEITANAIGAKFNSTSEIPIRTIINIGGQDSKIIYLNNDFKVVNFSMNDKCAAGTGRFLEIVSRSLEVDIEDLAELHFQNNETPLTINSTCAVFAESEIISLLADGKSKCAIASGVHYSIAKKIVRLASRTELKDSILFDGGTALNKGLKSALEDELMRDLFTPVNPQITTAIGAAYLAEARSSIK